MSALDIIYNIVLSDEVVELRALVVCNKIALGRFRISFLDDLKSVGSVSLPLNITKIQ